MQFTYNAFLGGTSLLTKSMKKYVVRSSNKELFLTECCQNGKVQHIFEKSISREWRMHSREFYPWEFSRILEKLFLEQHHYTLGQNLFQSSI